MTSQQADRRKEIFKNKSLKLLDNTMAGHLASVISLNIAGTALE